MIRVTAPASTANLGSGFDCMGIALRLYNTADFEETDSGLEINILDDSKNFLPTDQNNYIYKCMDRVFKLAGKHPKVMKARNWVNTINKKALFLIITMPFTPSCFVNFAMGVSDFDAKTYIKVMAGAKVVMLLLLSLFGQSVVQAFENPVFIVLAVLLVVVLYLVSRYIRKRHNLD